MRINYKQLEKSLKEGTISDTSDFLIFKMGKKKYSIDLCNPFFEQCSSSCSMILLNEINIMSKEIIRMIFKIYGSKITNLQKKRLFSIFFRYYSQFLKEESELEASLLLASTTDAFKHFDMLDYYFTKKCDNVSRIQVNNVNTENDVTIWIVVCDI